jgi:hypothetical protein
MTNFEEEKDKKLAEYNQRLLFSIEKKSRRELSPQKNFFANQLNDDNN